MSLNICLCSYVFVVVRRPAYHSSIFNLLNRLFVLHFPQTVGKSNGNTTKVSVKRAEEKTIANLKQILRESLKKTTPSDVAIQAKRISAIKQAVPKVKKAIRARGKQLDTIIIAEKQIANEIKDVNKVLLEKPTKEMKSVAKQRTQHRKRPTKKEIAKVKKMTHELNEVNKVALVFRERAKLLADKNVSADKKVNLLREMEKSVLDQESALKRIKRMLTSPTFWIAIAAIGLIGYGISQADPILHAYKEAAVGTGTAAKNIGEGVSVAAGAATQLVTATACLSLNWVPGWGVPLSIACGIGAAAYAKFAGEGKFLHAKEKRRTKHGGKRGKMN